MADAPTVEKDADGTSTPKPETAAAKDKTQGQAPLGGAAGGKKKKKAGKR